MGVEPQGFHFLKPSQGLAPRPGEPTAHFGVGSLFSLRRWFQAKPHDMGNWLAVLGGSSFGTDMLPYPSKLTSRWWSKRGRSQAPQKTTERLVRRGPCGSRAMATGEWKNRMLTDQCQVLAYISAIRQLPSLESQGWPHSVAASPKWFGFPVLGKDLAQEGFHRRNFSNKKRHLCCT